MEPSPSLTTTSSSTGNRRNWVLAAVTILVVAIASFHYSVSNTAAQSLLEQLPQPIDQNNKQVPNTYVGKVAGTDYLVAVVIDSSRVAVGYLCDGKNDSWLTGSVSSELSPKLKLNGDGATLTGTLKDDVVTGEVTTKTGLKEKFTAKLAAGQDGLYRISDDVGLGGWIRYDQETKGFFRKRRGSSGGSTTPPPPPVGATDPCAGMGATVDSANNPGACQAAICDAASKTFATATSSSERQSAEAIASANGCILDPFISGSGAAQ